MTEDLLDYWLRLIKPLFPANAWVASRFSDGGHLIQIDWKLDNDPSRPNKRSRKILITISEQVIDDYLDKSKMDRERSDIKLKELIVERYKHFNPDHNASTSNTVSTEKWLISTNTLNA